MPRELEMAYAVEHYGAAAVVDRPLGVTELRRMNVAGRVVGAYRSRDAYRDKDGAVNWAEWAGKYPEQNKLLNYAMIVAEGEEDDDG